ncbi:dicarboxylate/amino acid:cation symporter [Fluviispira multicolorata]|uniref:Cation:dicarboxylase symporter family transporter n=1 Tax=Fluviispira multicolorata TaxID=2654512 RepID=A0A833N4L5_9BACT|nr:cation:dicarboxylase symporter family transporter [Fluviispira multicolorata]KAB8032151.1 cation:dicarboxylase symporter family transporter [Fluviispira multicolorata]
MIKKIKSLLLNHWTIFISMFLGALFGIFAPKIAKQISFLGDLYLDFLQITVIPIMMSALICSFYNIFHSSDSIYYLKRLVIIFFSCMIAVTFISVFLCIIIGPGNNLSTNAVQLLNNSIGNSEKLIRSFTPSSTSHVNFIEYFENIIPTNIVKSIYDRKDISILLFSILLGIALGITNSPSVKIAVSFFDAIFLSFLKMVDILMYFLPFGIFFLISGFLSNVGIQTLRSLFDLIALIYATIITFFITFSIIISRTQKKPILTCLKKLKNAYLIAFGTSSSFAAMPTAMLALTQDFKVNKQSVELVMPLGVSLFKPGVMIRSIAIAIFLMNLYKIPISISSMTTLFFASWAASIASTAGPAILSATSFGIVLSPLGIPPSIGIFLLLSIEPLIDPFITMLNIQGNCAVTLMVAKKE